VTFIVVVKTNARNFMRIKAIDLQLSESTVLISMDTSVTFHQF